MNRTREMVKNASKQSVSAIQKYIKKDLKTFFSEETQKISSSTITSIQKEAEKRLSSINKYKVTRKGTDNQINNYIDQKKLSTYKNALIKGYAFIMKTREFITNEKISYLFMVDSFSQNPTIAKLQLEDFLAGINIIPNSDGKMKLQLSNLTELENIVKKNALTGAISDNIINQYKNLRWIRKNQDGTRRLQGFVLEQSIRAVAAGKTVDYETDIEAFYRGGDLKGNEIPLDLTDKNENLEVKNLASKRYGAQLASEGTIETVLISIIEICKKSNNIENFKEIINKFIFQADKNIDQRLTKKIGDSLEDKVSKALDDFITNLNLT